MQRLRRGAVETRLLTTNQCWLSAEPIRQRAAAIDDLAAEPVTCQVELPEAHQEHHEPGHLAAEPAEARPALAELAGWIGQGFRPRDFEPHEMNGKPRLAVLLHRSQAVDWFMVPATVPAVACRQRLLDPAHPADGTVLGIGRFRLVDLDLLPTGSAHERARGGISSPPGKPPVLHNGLVHDGGTAEPP